MHIFMKFSVVYMSRACVCKLLCALTVGDDCLLAQLGKQAFGVWAGQNCMHI